MPTLTATRRPRCLRDEKQTPLHTSVIEGLAEAREAFESDEPLPCVLVIEQLLDPRVFAGAKAGIDAAPREGALVTALLDLEARMGTAETVAALSELTGIALSALCPGASLAAAESVVGSPDDAKLVISLSFSAPDPNTAVLFSPTGPLPPFGCDRTTWTLVYR